MPGFSKEKKRPSNSKIVLKQSSLGRQWQALGHKPGEQDQWDEARHEDQESTVYHQEQ